MSEEVGVNSGRVTYTTKELLDGINDKLARQQILGEQQEKRLTRLENQVEHHAEILTVQVPKLSRVIEELDVKQQVEDALDSKKLRGVSSLDRIVVGSLGACVILIAVIGNIGHIVHG